VEKLVARPIFMFM